MRRLALPLPSRGGEIAAIAFGNPDQPINALFLHGNGFNALTHRTLLAPLAANHHVIAIDQRGHGRSALPADPTDRWDYSDLVADLVAVVAALGLERVVLAGHSMGGTVCLLAAPLLPQIVSGLVLLDPAVVLDKERELARLLLAGDPGRHPMYAAALARRSTFSDHAEAVAHHRGRGSFQTWPDALVADYVEDGFLHVGNSVELACSPRWEASNFLAHDHSVWQALASLDAPTTILVPEQGAACRIGDPAAPIEPPLGVTVERIAGTTHFLPMERPDLVQEQLIQAIGRMS